MIVRIGVVIGPFKFEHTFNTYAVNWPKWLVRRTPLLKGDQSPPHGSHPKKGEPFFRYHTLNVQALTLHQRDDV